MTEEAEKPPSLSEEELKAIDYIARTPEGRLLYRYLRRVLESVVDMVEPSTLQQSHGRRSLARDLMRHMTSGISDTSGTSERSHTTDAPILTGASKPVDARRRTGSGTRRRVTDDTRTSYEGPTGDDTGGTP